ncbi:MAG: F0F1 ATP synthase subunit gamma [Chloroflexi bacterium]|nr:F0F1 ATP synthase subunit gamma [Chloroflexota bacterium]
MEIRIEQWRERQGIGRVFLFYNKPDTPSTYRPYTLQVWSIDLTWLQGLKQRKWPTRVLPTFTMDFDQLFAALIREYFFVSLYRAFVESLASENASRLSSMQVAERNVERRLETLNTEYHRARQSSITEELLDIVAGFEALNPPE